MSAAVDVIVDREDDIATVMAIRALAAREPGVLAVSIVPGMRSETEVVWAILRALGKRIDQLTNNKVWWFDAERWLTAHRITEIAVLCAQHLDERTIDELKAHVCRRLGVPVALIYGRSTRRAAAAADVTDLGAYLARKRDPPPDSYQAEPWPQLPRSHPLRFRYDCWRELAPEQFARVERRLFDCMTMLGGWCRSSEPSRLAEIARAFRVLIETDDPELAYIRRCGAELALMTHQIPALPAARLSLRAHRVTAREIDALHAYTNPARAGYELAKLITRLPDELLALISYEQITDDAILGCPVPHTARPILRAIEDRHEPSSTFRGRTRPTRARTLRRGTSRPRSRQLTSGTSRQRSDRCSVDAAFESNAASCHGQSARGSRRCGPTGSLTGATASTAPATPRSTAAFALTAPPIRALTNE